MKVYQAINSVQRTLAAEGDGGRATAERVALDPRRAEANELTFSLTPSQEYVLRASTVASLGLKVKITNQIEQAGCRTVWDVLHLWPEDVLEWRNCSHLTLREIRRAALVFLRKIGVETVNQSSEPHRN